MPDEQPKLRQNKKQRYIVKPNQYGSGGWLIAPALLEIFRATEPALLEVAEKRQQSVTQVDWVRCARLENEKRIYIYPSDAKDPDAIEVKRYGGKTSINLISFMAPEGLCVEQGYKERYFLGAAGPDSPAGPALVFDMEKPVERKPVAPSKRSGARRKAKQESAPAAPAAPEL
jgi:hypothetical protein